MKINENSSDVIYVYIGCHIDIVFFIIIVQTVSRFYIISIVLFLNLGLRRNPRLPLSLAYPHTNLVLLTIKWQSQCPCEINLYVVVFWFQKLFSLCYNICV